MRRFSLVVFSLLLFQGSIFSESQNTESIVIVFDLSFSMRLSAGRMSRLDAGREAVASILQEPGAAHAEWALVLFDDTGAVREAVPFTCRTHDIEAALSKANYWALSPIDEGLRYGMELLGKGSGQKKTLILVSDCIPSPETHLPDPELYATSGVSLFVLGYKLTQNPGLQRAATEWAEKAGGEFFTVDQVRLLRKRLFDLPNGNESQDTVIKQAADTAEAARQNEDEKRSVDVLPQKSTVSYDVQFNTRRFDFALPLRNALFLPALGFSLAACIQSIAFVRSKRQKRRLTVHEPLTMIEVRHPDGKTEEYRLTGAKAVFGNVEDVDLVLPKFSLSGRKKSFITFSQAGADSVVAVFSVPVILSGVETREVRLGRDRTMRIGAYQFTYRGTPSEAEESDRSPSLSVGVYSLATVLLTVVCFVPSIPVTLAYPLPRVFQHEQTEFRSLQNLNEDASFDSSEDESLDAIPIEHEENGSSSVQAGMYQPSSLAPELQMEREPSRTEVKTVPPGGHIDAGPFDVLFIHAHPDDESLDFGVLMARASRAGKRVAVVILTDGEGGIDQYPRRIVGGKYRPYDMTGSELSQVRVMEARNALSILGCSLYVRLGLRNDSYNGTRDEKTLDAKLDRWGGREKAVDTVYRLIRELKPTLVVSPDAASRAREHYEHEATGWIVRKAVDKARADLDNTVRAHITSVDTLQRGVYPDRIAVNAMLKDAETGLTYRDIQAQALLEHRTQRDASVIGVEVLKNFRSEFYHVRFWNLDGNIESYLSD